MPLLANALSVVVQAALRALSLSIELMALEHSVCHLLEIDMADLRRGGAANTAGNGARKRIGRNIAKIFTC